MHKQHVGHKLQCFDIRELIANTGSPSYNGSTDLQRWEHCSQKYKHLEVLFQRRITEMWNTYSHCPWEMSLEWLWWS